MPVSTTASDDELAAVVAELGDSRNCSDELVLAICWSYARKCSFNEINQCTITYILCKYLYTLLCMFSIFKLRVHANEER